MNTAAPVPTTTPVDEKEFAAAIMVAGEHIKINKMLARDLSRLLFDTGEDVVVSLLEFVAQPDPYKTVRSVLRKKADESLETWATSDANDFGHWVKSANFCYHSVNNLLRENGYELDEIAVNAVQGVRHYWDCTENYGEEAIKNFALITAAVELSILGDTEEPFGTKLTEKITDSEHTSNLKGHDHFNCYHLVNQTIKDLVSREPEKVDPIVKSILDHGYRSEKAIIHYLDGGHGTLVTGAL